MSNVLVPLPPPQCPIPGTEEPHRVGSIRRALHDVLVVGDDVAGRDAGVGPPLIGRAGDDAVEIVRETLNGLQRLVGNRAGEAAVADDLELAVPRRDRQPDFGLDGGARRRPECGGHATEGW